MREDEFYQRLRSLIGRRCTLADGEWEIIDVLERDDCFVIRCLSGPQSPIQADAFGNPSRRAPDIRMVPLSIEPGQFTPEAEDLLRSLQPRA